MRSIISALALGLAIFSPSLANADEAALGAARGVMDDFMTAFNAKDEDAWAATFNYPHIRFASGKVIISPDAKSITEAMDFAAFSEMSGWDRSAWDKVEALDAGSTKVHFKVTFSRYSVEGQKLATYDSLYVVTLKDGHWGVQARSSFAP
jgi:hypothetical protein